MTAIVIAAATASGKFLFSSAVLGAQDAATLSFQQMLGKEVAAASEPANTGAARATWASTSAAWDELSAASSDSAWPDVLALLPGLRAGLPSPAPAVPVSASIRQYAPIATPSTRELGPELAGATIAIPSSQQRHGIDRGPTDTQVLPGPALKVQAAPASGLASPQSHAPRDGIADEREITDAASVPSASTELPEAHTRHPATSALPAGAMPDTASAPTGVATTASVSHLIAPSFAQTGWDEAISQRVLWMAQGGIQSASLVLNPPQLGPVQVTLQIENQQASVQFFAASPQVQQSLQDALPVLRDMLGQAGIALGQADVGSQPQQQRNPGTASANPFMATPDNASGPAQRADKTVPLKLLPVRRGLINLYA